MVNTDYDKGAKIFSVGEDLILNWSNQGYIFKTPNIVEVNIHREMENTVTVYDERLRKVIDKPVNNSTLEIRVAFSSLNTSNKPFDFTNLMSDNISRAEMLRAIYKQLEDKNERK